jgi:hypothetical protein
MSAAKVLMNILQPREFQDAGLHASVLAPIGQAINSGATKNIDATSSLKKILMPSAGPSAPTQVSGEVPKDSAAGGFMDKLKAASEMAKRKSQVGEDLISKLQKAAKAAHAETENKPDAGDDLMRQLASASAAFSHTHMKELRKNGGNDTAAPVKGSGSGKASKKGQSEKDTPKQAKASTQNHSREAPTSTHAQAQAHAGANAGSKSRSNSGLEESNGRFAGSAVLTSPNPSALPMPNFEEAASDFFDDLPPPPPHPVPYAMMLTKQPKAQTPTPTPTGTASSPARPPMGAAASVSASAGAGKNSAKNGGSNQNGKSPKR